MEVIELPAPAAAPGKVIVSAEAIGVGRPDVMIRTGRYKWMPPLPAIIGNELCGTVSAIGAGVPDALLGVRVLVSSRELTERGGCYAEQVAVPAAAVIELPGNIDPVHAVALPNYQLAWALLHEATRGKRPRSLFLNGAAGGVGSAVIDLCRILGISVVAAASTAEKRAFAVSRGANHAVDSSLVTDNPKAFVSSVLSATGGVGTDALFDHLGGDGVHTLLDILAPFGMLVSYNALNGPPTGDVYASLRQKGSKGLSVCAFNMHAFDTDRQRRRSLLSAVTQMMEDGRIEPHIHMRLPLSEARKAHEMLDRNAVIGKLVFVPGE